MNAIEIENVGKQYRLGLVSSGTISHDLNRWWAMNILHKEDPYLKIGETNDRSKKGNSDYVWALKDINFNVEQGDVVGIIGKNGAGKSTLLKLLSRVTTPTTGEIRVRGRIASLLEVGTGFHPEMTGRENIYMNGAIMGMTKHEIASKLDEIIDFSGCERYIDTPVKRYSSGMTVRLGFAVAAHLEPEILIVDEVLAVGDAEFQKKAIGKMQDISHGGGRTVLFVSHNMDSIQRLCKKGCLLENGMVKFQGTANETIQEYLKKNITQSSFEGIDGNPEVMCLEKVSVTSNENNILFNNAPINIDFDVCISKKIGSLVVGFNIYSQYDYPISRSDYNDEDGRTSLEPGKYRFHFVIPPYTLATGEYKIIFDIAEKGIKRYTTEKSNVSFSVTQGNDCFGNTFSENIRIKSSLFREKWLNNIEKL